MFCGRQTVQALILISLSAAAGFALGNMTRPGETPAASQPTAPRREERAQPPPRPHPEPFDDFRSLLLPDSRETDIWKVVSRISPDRIQDAIREIHQLDKRGTYLPRKDEILSALYFHWAENDPKAALAGLPPAPKDIMASIAWRGLAKSVLTAWMRMDPEAAFSAAKATNKDFYYMGRDMLVQTWTPENLFQNLDRHPENRSDLMAWYCSSLAFKPEARDAMLKTLKDNPNMKDAGTAAGFLLIKWGYQDFDAAIAKAQDFHASQIVKQIIRTNMPFRGDKALPCAVENEIPPGGPDWETGYSGWLSMNGPEARKWFKEQELSWELDGHADAAAAFLALDYANAKAANLAAEQAEAERRFQRLVERWQRKDPQSVRKWLDTAPKAARELIDGKGGQHGK